MATVTIRNLPDEVHRALRVRAATHGRSTEAEIRSILESIVRPAERIKLGSTIAALSREFGLTDADVDALQTVNHPPAEPMKFE